MTQHHMVSPTRSYLSQSSPELVFGLGKADKIESLTVRWPSGAVTEVPAVELAVDRRVEIAE
jgi:hypothetical protein